MTDLRFSNQATIEGRVRIARGAFAFATFLTITSVTFVALTEVALGLLEATASFRPSAAFAFAMVIYAPGLILFFIVGVIAGLWASRRAYFRPALPPLGRAVLRTFLMIAALVAGAFLLLSLALPQDDRPLLAVGLYGMTPAVNEAFTGRLQKRFPPGSPESALLDELRKEKFSIDMDQRSAYFDGDGFPCRNIWHVSWQSKNGGLLSVSGSLPKVPICL